MYLKKKAEGTITPNHLLTKIATPTRVDSHEQQKNNEGGPPTTRASSAAARSSCPLVASRAKEAGAAKIR